MNWNLLSGSPVGTANNKHGETAKVCFYLDRKWHKNSENWTAQWDVSSESVEEKTKVWKAVLCHSFIVHQTLV